MYPVNRPLRDYQYEIVEKALFNNTMVVLPTGLGKTFIAAVVMYNYHRWYPSSKHPFSKSSNKPMKISYNELSLPRVSYRLTRRPMTLLYHSTSRERHMLGTVFLLYAQCTLGLLSAQGISWRICKMAGK